MIVRMIPVLVFASGMVMSVLATRNAHADVIEIHNTMSPGGAEEAALQRFQSIVNDEFSGRLSVAIYLDGERGDEADVLEKLHLGQTQMALTGGMFMGEYAAEFDAVSVPFVFPDWPAVEHYITQTDSGAALQAAAREHGNLVYLGPQMRAFRHMTSAVPISSPDDLDGLLMRLPNIPTWIDVWETLGVQPVIMPAPEFVEAMRTGEVQAHENSLASPYTRKLWEVQDYVITTAHVSFPWHWVASAAWWETLTNEEQMILTQAVEQARQHGIATEMETDQAYREALIDRGMTFIDVEQAPFREKAAPAVEQALTKKSAQVARDIEIAISATRSSLQPQQ